MLLSCAAAACRSWSPLSHTDSVRSWPLLPSPERVLPPSANSLSVPGSQPARPKGQWEEVQGPGGQSLPPPALGTVKAEKATSKGSPSPCPGQGSHVCTQLVRAVAMQCWTVLVPFPGALGVDAGQHTPWPLKTGTRRPSPAPPRGNP